MCLCCIEYNKGNLTWKEYERNMKEMKDQGPHDDQALFNYEFEKRFEEIFDGEETKEEKA